MASEKELEQAKRTVIAGIDAAIVTLKGSVELRDAVEDLLKGTPYEKPADDYEGLYGRLRSALKAQPAAEAVRASAPLNEETRRPVVDAGAFDLAHGLPVWPLSKRLGYMADAMVSAKVGPKARFFSRERVDEIVLLLREAEKELVNRG
jgi:hypothetical protein